MKSATLKQAITAAVLAGLALSSGRAAAGPMEQASAGLADLGIKLPELSLEAVPAPAAADRYINMNDLLVLLRDYNPEVRKAALRSAKDLIVNNRVSEQVMDILHNQKEQPDIRLEAARMLSYAAQYIKVQDALAQAARNEAEPAELRIMAYKALWSAATGYSRVQQFLVDSVKLEKEPAVRRAVVWAMFDSTRNNKTRDLLIDLLRYRKEDETTKIEIIKSLYEGMVYQQTQDMVMAMINDPEETKPVKITALLSLSGVSGSRPQQFLESVVRNAKDQDLRAAAVEALAPSKDRMREFFHLAYTVENGGGAVNPIEKE